MLILEEYSKLSKYVKLKMNVVTYSIISSFEKQNVFLLNDLC